MVANPNAEALALSTNQRTVSGAVFGNPGDTVAIKDTGAGGVGQISAGDTVEITNAQGVKTTQVVTAEQAYNVNFRSNLIGAAEKASDPAWDFTESIVEMPNNKLTPPQTRTGPDGSTQSVLSRNEFWEVVEKRGTDGKPFQFLKVRATDDQGNPVKVSDAINDLFDNKGDYIFDCATPIHILSLKAQLDTVGADDFNRANAGLSLHSHFDGADTNGDTFDSGFSKTVQFAQPGNPDGAIPGVEFTRFDRNNDKLVPGEWRYFEKAGDDSSATQGTNRIYLGPGANGQDKFWVIGGGVESFNVNNPPLGEYLTSLRGAPDTNHLMAIDRTVGVG